MKIIIHDLFNVGDKCSLQGTDPGTKRPMLFHGHVLAVFDTRKEAENKINELVTPHEIKEPFITLDGPRPCREPKPSKRKLAALENAVENISEKNKGRNHSAVYLLHAQVVSLC